jgi:hypothetical protein
LANTKETKELEKNTIDENLEMKKLDTFEEIVVEDCINTLVQNI